MAADEAWNGITNAPSSLPSARIEASWSTAAFNPVARYVKQAAVGDWEGKEVDERIQAVDKAGKNIGNIRIINTEPGVIQQGYTKKDKDDKKPEKAAHFKTS